MQSTHTLPARVRTRREECARRGNTRSNRPVSVTRHESYDLLTYLGMWRAPAVNRPALDSLCTRGEDCGSHGEARCAALVPCLLSVALCHRRTATRPEQSSQAGLACVSGPTMHQTLSTARPPSALSVPESLTSCLSDSRSWCVDGQQVPDHARSVRGLRDELR